MTDIERPLTVAELAVQRARQGRLTSQTSLWVLAASQLIVPTPALDFNGDLNTFVPVLVGRDDLTFLVAFTAADRMVDFVDRAPQFISLAGTDVLRWLPAEVGLIVNPGTEFGFELPWQGVAAIRAELAE